MKSIIAVASLSKYTYGAHTATSLRRDVCWRLQQKPGHVRKLFPRIDMEPKWRRRERQKFQGVGPLLLICTCREGDGNSFAGNGLGGIF
jgi:hypothetical protein